MATNGGVVNGTDNSLKDLITSSKKDKFQTLALSHEIISGVSRQITGIDNELSTVARMQQFKSYSDSKSHESPQGALAELYESIHEIKLRSAKANEAMIKILDDKQKVDFAKARILSSSTSSLSEIITLQCVFSQLEAETKNVPQDYLKLSDLLKRTKQCLEEVESYVLVDKIEEIRQKFSALIGILKRKLLKSFREIGQIMDGVSTSGPGLVPHYSDVILISLHNAYLIFEILGPESMEDLMEEIVQSQLLTYDKMGREDGSLYSLSKESFDRRWSGLRRLLYAADQRLSDVFPHSWMLSHRLYLEFCDRTIRHLKSLLDEDYARYKSVCTACVLARAAERGDGYHTSTAAASSTGQLSTPSLSNTTDALSTSTGLQETQEYVSRIVIAFKSVISLEEEMSLRYEEDICSLNPMSQTEEEILGKLTQGSIMSSLFDDYMGPYVQLERKNLDDIIRELISQDDLSNTALTAAINQQKEQTRNDLKAGLSSNSTSSNHNNRIFMEQIANTSRQIYDSSGRLFETIRQSFKRCVALTNSKPLYLLSLEYCGCIEIYSQELQRRCPLINYPSQNRNNLNVVGGNKMPQYRMPLEDEIAICRVINTAEYCSEVIPKLESQIKTKIKINYENLIQFQKQTDLFIDVIATSVGMLVKGVLSLTDGVIKVMKKINWATVPNVGDESSYIAIMKTTLYDVIPRLRNALSSTWFKNFCRKFSLEFLDQFLAAIMTQKKITPIGAEQLLLDTNALRTLLLSLHHIGISSKDSEKRNQLPIPATYTSFVTARFQHIAVVLKLVCTPEDQFEEMFGILWPEGTVSEMQAVYELKHNPSMISSTANAVGDLSAATTRVAVGGTKSALGATSRAFEASTKAIGGSMSKTLATMKIATSLKKKRSSTATLGDRDGGGMDNSS